MPLDRDLKSAAGLFENGFGAGRVRQIVPTADRQRATVQVKVSITDHDPRILPEMGARVEFLDTAPRRADAPARIFVPAEAVDNAGGATVVWVVRDGRVKRTTVEAGPVSGGRREVRSGLSGGESLVIDPPQDLSDGAQVNVITQYRYGHGTGKGRSWSKSAASPSRIAGAPRRSGCSRTSILDIRQGEFLALMGPSGSGKTTLLNILAGLDTPTAGSVVVDGQDITRMNGKQLAAWRSTHIGFIFQFYNLLPVLTAAQNVELPLLLTNLSKKAAPRPRDGARSRSSGLTDRAEHFPRQLSGGQQQRVGIARAVVSDPTIILGDEPTGDLDAASGKEILDLLERLSSEFGKTIVMVTHDAHAAERAQAIMHMDKGVLSR